MYIHKVDMHVQTLSMYYCPVCTPENCWQCFTQATKDTTGVSVKVAVCKVLTPTLSSMQDKI